MKRRVRLTESDIHRIVKESVRRVLNENSDINLEWESDDYDWRIPVDYKCTIREDGYAESTTSLYGHKHTIGLRIPFPLYDKNGELNEYKIEKFVEREWDKEISRME